MFPFSFCGTTSENMTFSGFVSSLRVLFLPLPADIVRVQVTGGPPPPPPASLIRPVMNQGFVDSNDPSIVYVCQPKFDEVLEKDDAGI